MSRLHVIFIMGLTIFGCAKRDTNSLSEEALDGAQLVDGQTGSIRALHSHPIDLVRLVVLVGKTNLRHGSHRADWQIKVERLDDEPLVSANGIKLEAANQDAVSFEQGAKEASLTAHTGPGRDGIEVVLPKNTPIRISVTMTNQEGQKFISQYEASTILGAYSSKTLYRAGFRKANRLIFLTYLKEAGDAENQ